MVENSEQQAPSRRTQIQQFWQQGWPKGWRTDVDKAVLPADHVSDLLNIRWEPDYTVRKRNGYVQIADDTVSGLEIPDFVLAPRVFTLDGLFPQYSQIVSHFGKTDGELWYQSLGKLWEEHEDPGEGDDLTWSNHSIGPASDTATNRFRVWPINAVTFDDKIYYFGLRFGGYDNNTDTGDSESGDWQTVDGNQASQSKPIVFDVDEGTWSRPDVANLDEGETSGHFPQARTGLAKYARIFVGNVYLEDTLRYPSRIYWSGSDTDPIDVGIWDKDNYITCGADDGQEIIRMLSFGDQILIIKNQSVWTLVGTDDTTFALYQLDDKYGTEATYAATSIAGKAWFLDEREGVMQFDGSQFVNISEPIKDKLLDELNRESAYKNVVQWHDDLLYVSICAGTSKVQNVTYVYDTQLKTWSRWDFGMVPSPFPMYSDLQITGPEVALSRNLFGGTPSKGVFEFNTGLQDDGSAFDSYVTTPWMNLGQLGVRHRLRRFHLLADEADNEITIDIFKDLEFDSAEATLTYDPAAGTESALDMTRSIDTFMWQYICFRFTQDGDNEDMNVRGFGGSVSVRPTPRGIMSKTGYTA